MTRAELAARTKAFALAIIRLVETFPRGRSAEVIAGQLLRSGTSVAANYRAACRARSRREFVAKMGIAEEEADEAMFWLEVVADSKMLDRGRVTPLREEANQLVAIVVSSIRTARGTRVTMRASASLDRETPHSNPQSAIRNPQCL